jgi:hypothetical protein
MQSMRHMDYKPNVVLRSLLVCAAIGCGSSDAARECEAQSPTITTGFAGCVASEDDVGDPPPPATATANFEVAVYLTEPSSDLKDGVEPDFDTHTDAHGFYQVTVPPGVYWLCTAFRRCTKQEVRPMSVVRLDYSFSAGPGWSEPIN